jgi:hypothetical protein
LKKELLQKVNGTVEKKRSEIMNHVTGNTAVENECNGAGKK